ncbi:MAG: copper amine oxidase N-terminal domain-containing protein, partial [Clostridia bacterium]|nr:copper amine oxidase N-terminal domain-containing protein [Clostridia bacterium]
MKRLIETLVLISVFLIVPCQAMAQDCSERISNSDSFIKVSNTSLKVFDVEDDYTDDDLCEISVSFYETENKRVYDRRGDSVNFYIKSSSSKVIGWVDTNDNGRCESREKINGTKSVLLSSNNGYHVDEAELTRDSKIKIYLGATEEGTYSVGIFTDKGAKQKDQIGQVVAFKVEPVEGEVVLSAYDGDEKLSGHSGYKNDPYEVNAGETLYLHAVLKDGDKYIRDTKITFKKSRGVERFEVIGTEVTDDDGEAELRYEEEKSGLCSIIAETDAGESIPMYIDYQAYKPEEFIPLTKDGQKIVLKEPMTIKFLVEDDLGNPVFSDGDKDVEFMILDAPKYSVYNDYTGMYVSTDEDGVAEFTFVPDWRGSYTIKCRAKESKRGDSIEVEADYLEKVADMNFQLKNDGSIIPAVKYTDKNNDGKPEIAGRIEVELEDVNGAKLIALGKKVQTVHFESANEGVVSIEPDGDVVVKDKNYIGNVKITVKEDTGDITKEYILKIAGEPVTLETKIKAIDKKAYIELQYKDSKGNDTWSSASEDYEIDVPTTKLAVFDNNKFKSDGKASFMLLADEYGEFEYKIRTSKTRMRETFKISFKKALPLGEVMGAKNVTMFIGMKSYIQDDNPKLTDVPPFIKEGRTFVAVRPVAEAFGSKINWDPVTQKVTLSRNDMKITIEIGSKNIVKEEYGNITLISSDVPAFIQEGRTVLPFRAVGEAFGAEVNYSPEIKSVSYLQEIK